MAMCLQAHGLPKMERALVHVAQTSRSQWHTVVFSSPFSAPPVVLMGPPTYNGSPPLTVLVKDVTAEGFAFQLAEWLYDNGSHDAETVSYFAIEPGLHNLGGLQCEARISELPATSATYQIALTAALPAEPAVFPQAVFPTGGAAPEPVTVRVTERTAATFKVRVRREQSRGSNGPALHVHWLAIVPGRGHDWTSQLDFHAAVSSAFYGEAFNDLTFAYRPISLPSPPPGAQWFLASMQTYNDSQPATLRYRNGSNVAVDIKVQEETSEETNVVHSPEAIGTFLMWNSPEPKIEYGALALSVNNGNKSQHWHVKAFDSHVYENPVVIFGPVSYADSAPVTVRARNVTATQFEVTLQEFAYTSNPVHGEEVVPYLVIEEGIFNIGGSIWQSGFIDKAPDEYKRYNRFLPSAFPDPQSPPVFLAQVVSNRDSSPVLIRARGVDGAGFELKLAEEEADASTGHESERVHFLALSQSLSPSGAEDGFEAVVTGSEFTDAWKAIAFTRPFADGYVFAQTRTVNASDPYTIRYKNWTGQSVEFQLDEEKSADSETSHSTPEAMGWLALGTLVPPPDPDADDDGMTDEWEAANGLNSSVDDAGMDADGDGLTNLQEFLQGGRAQNPDTDGDGYLDGFEVAAGWRPGEIDGASGSSLPAAITLLLVFTPAR